VQGEFRTVRFILYIVINNSGLVHEQQVQPAIAVDIMIDGGNPCLVLRGHEVSLDAAKCGTVSGGLLPAQQPALLRADNQIEQSIAIEVDQERCGKILSPRPTVIINFAEMLGVSVSGSDEKNNGAQKQNERLAHECVPIDHSRILLHVHAICERCSKGLLISLSCRPRESIIPSLSIFATFRQRHRKPRCWRCSGRENPDINTTNLQNRLPISKQVAGSPAEPGIYVCRRVCPYPDGHRYRKPVAIRKHSWMSRGKGGLLCSPLTTVVSAGGKYLQTPAPGRKRQ
jgi:hypothetical protein